MYIYIYSNVYMIERDTHDPNERHNHYECCLNVYKVVSSLVDTGNTSRKWTAHSAERDNIKIPVVCSPRKSMHRP